MEQTPQNPLLPEGNQQSRQQNGETGWTIGVLALIVIVLLVGVRLATWKGGQQTASSEQPVAAEQTALVSQTVGNDIETVKTVVPEGSGEVAFVISSPSAVIVREIYLYNSFRAQNSQDPWFLVYDGYRQVSAEPIEVFRVTLAPIIYEKVRVRVLSVDTGASVERTKDVKIEVKSGSTTKVEVVL